MARMKLATIWLGGCSGCHMSFLDLDEWLLELAAQADLVFSPVIDTKVFPEGVDVTLVEGAVANEEHWHMIQTARARTQTLVAFGDCAVTGNVTAIRNVFASAEPVLRRSYQELADLRPGLPSSDLLPVLCDRVFPVHQVVPVEYYIPGCPPPADRIRHVLEALLAGKTPTLEGRELKFG